MRYLLSFPTRRSSDLIEPGDLCNRAEPYSRRLPRAAAARRGARNGGATGGCRERIPRSRAPGAAICGAERGRSEEHTSELQSLRHLVCRLLLEKKNNK